jgi:hypothetical protein
VELKVALTDHAYHRAISRLGFTGTKEELVEKLNESFNKYYNIGNIWLYSVHDNIVFATVYDNVRKVLLAKTVYREVFVPDHRNKIVNVEWKLPETIEN